MTSTSNRDEYQFGIEIAKGKEVVKNGAAAADAPRNGHPFKIKIIETMDEGAKALFEAAAMDRVTEAMRGTGCCMVVCNARGFVNCAPDAPLQQVYKLVDLGRNFVASADNGRNGRNGDGKLNIVSSGADNNFFYRVVYEFAGKNGLEVARLAEGTVVMSGTQAPEQAVEAFEKFQRRYDGMFTCFEEDPEAVMVVLDGYKRMGQEKRAVAEPEKRTGREADVINILERIISKARGRGDTIENSSEYSPDQEQSLG